jgi:hypothetical protein
MRDRLTGFQLMRVPKFMAYERVQIAREDERDLAARLSEGASMCARWKLPEARLKGCTADGNSFGGLPLDKRGDVACEACRRLSGEGYVYRAGDCASG